MVDFNRMFDFSILDIHYADGSVFLFDATRDVCVALACGDGRVRRGAEARAEAEERVGAVLAVMEASEGRGLEAATGVLWMSLTPFSRETRRSWQRLFWHDPDDPRFGEAFFEALPMRTIY